MSLNNPPGPADVPCQHCGEMMNEDDLYCRYCGRPMVSTGFDDDGNVVVRSRTRTGPGLRGVGEQSRLPDPQDHRPKREGALARVSGGPIGCTGLLAIGIGALLVLMLVAWFLLRPGIGDAARDGIDDGLARELNLHSIAPATTTLAINEITINEYLDASAAWFEPVTDLDIAFHDNQIEVSFSLYGLSGAFSSGATVQDGLIRLVNPSVSGAAGRLIDVDEITRVIETRLRVFIQEEGRPITNISIDEGELTINIGG